MKSVCALVLIAAFIPLPPLFAADETPLPAGGVSIFAGDPAQAFTTHADASQIAPIETGTVTGQPFKQAIKLTTLARTDSPYVIQFGAPTSIPIHEGDVLFAQFYLKGSPGKPGGDAATTEFTIEQGSPEYKKLVLFATDVGPDWKRYSIPFVATKENIGGTQIPAGRANILFRLGYGPQTIEIGGLQILDFSSSVRVDDLPQIKADYPGREPDAAWRKEANDRIEKIRKADLRITVKDAAGHPLPGASVTVEMRRHAFGFGATVSAEFLISKGPDADKYRKTVLTYFNKVVIDNALKWPGWEKDRDTPIAVLHWLRDHNIEVRGHNLVWPGWHGIYKLVPNDVETLKDNPDAMRKRVDDHIVDELTVVKGLCCEWDVVNEPYTNHDVTDVLGPNAIADWFRLAHQIDPGAKLFLNDYDTAESGRQENAHTVAYERTIRHLLDQHAPISGIGIQSHFGWHLPAPVAVLAQLDRLAALGLDLEITEHDIDVTDEQLQADYTRDYMTLAFSHPAVTGFLSWGFWEGQHWKPEGAYFRKDWSIKPAGQVWIDLVMHQWWTCANGKTDAAGAYGTRGFLGDYDITVSGNGKTKTVHATLKKDSAPLEITLD